MARKRFVLTDDQKFWVGTALAVAGVLVALAQCVAPQRPDEPAPPAVQVVPVPVPAPAPDRGAPRGGSEDPAVEELLRQAPYRPPLTREQELNIAGEALRMRGEAERLAPPPPLPPGAAAQDAAMAGPMTPELLADLLDDRALLIEHGRARLALEAARKSRREAGTR